MIGKHIGSMAVLAAGLAVGCDDFHREGDYAPPNVQSCERSECHAAVERIHYGGPPLSCTDCHGGDPEDITKEGSHVTTQVSFNPSTPGARFLDEPSLATLDELAPEVVQFLNPSDYRVAAKTCGTGALGGAVCHGAIVDSSLLLNRATLAGQLAGGGFLAGVQDKTARYGVRQTTDALRPDVVPEGYAGELATFPAQPDPAAHPEAAAYFPVYEQLCLECHLYRDGARSPGLYYASGCSACHMVTEDDGRARTADPTQNREELGHVGTHRFTNLVPDRQCAHCHVSHLGRALLAQGIRERSEHEGDEAIGGPNRGLEDPEHAVPLSEERYVRHAGEHVLYGKPYPFFIEDEDSTNEVDETPPDVHTAAGMGCIDCHNIREAHGDGAMAQRMDHELDVRCQSCHGLPGERATLTSDALLPFNQSRTSVGGEGVNRPVMEVDADGDVLQFVRFTGALHPVTQITARTDAQSATFNPRTQMGCALHAGTAEVRSALKTQVNALAASDPAAVATAFPGLPEGFTFDAVATESDGRTECFTCHNSWTLNCYGCHMVRDDRQTYTSALDGLDKPGRVTNFGMTVAADELSLGLNARGRITPMVGTSIFFTHIDASGATAIDAVALADADGVAGDGNVHNPVHHHTVQQVPRDCTGCHPGVAGPVDAAKLATAAGLGSGRFLFEDGEGVEHVLDRTLLADWDGDGAPDPVPADVGPPVAVWPVASTTHTPLEPGVGEPGPLDLAGVRRMLEVRVVDQRE